MRNHLPVTFAAVVLTSLLGCGSREVGMIVVYWFRTGRKTRPADAATKKKITQNRILSRKVVPHPTPPRERKL